MENMTQGQGTVSWMRELASTPVTTTGSVVSPEKYYIDILDNGRTISDFIDYKIKECGLLANEEPFHVANLDNIVSRYYRWITNLPRVKPFYAVKCNNAAAVLRMMNVLDTGFDCASKGEIQMMLSLGVTPEKIIYAHTTKPMSHIRYACAHGVDKMTFDNEDELLKISLCHPKAKLVLRIAVDDSKSLVRLNSKFGASLESVGKLLERAGELDLEVIGVSFHVGSGCTDGGAFRQAIADARRVFDMGNLRGFQMRLLDIGGGFSATGDLKGKFEEFSGVINGALDEFFPSDSGVKIIAEPGRFYMQAAFTLAMNVIAKRVVLEEMDGHDAPGTTDGSVIFTTKKCDVEILDNGRTISDVIDSKIKERDSLANEEPFHVANLDNIVSRHHRWITNLPRVKPFYAVKCNNAAAVLRMMNVLDTGFDCASKGEIQMMLSLGVTPEKIIYAHTTKPMSHIRYACAHGVDKMTFDNEDELLKISLCHPKAKLVLRIAVDDSKSLVRLNSKFGASLESVGKLLERAGELDLEVIGVSFHVGSGCTDGGAFRQAIADARRVFDMGNLQGFQMRLLDIGGGFSATGDLKGKFEEFSGVINGALDEFFPSDSGVKIIAEPGRFYMQAAFTLAMNVIAKRVVLEEMDGHDDGDENSPDRMMMYYLNDGMYGSISCINYDAGHDNIEPYPHRAVESSERRYRSVLFGPTCNSKDKITEDYWMPECHVGDWLLVDNMGAYSVSVFTDFNGFERAHIYPVVTAETWHALNLSHFYNSC